MRLYRLDHSNLAVILQKIDGSDYWSDRLVFHTAFLYPAVFENGHHEFRFKFEIDGQLKSGEGSIAIGVADADKYETTLLGNDGLGDCAHSWSMYLMYREGGIELYHRRERMSHIQGKSISNGDILSIIIEKHGTRNEVLVLCDALLKETVSFGTNTSDIEKVKVGVSIYVDKKEGSTTRLRLIDYIFKRNAAE